MAAAAKQTTAGTKHGADAAADDNAAKRLKGENGAAAAAPEVFPDRPKDWPIADNRIPIDLDVQDRPHNSSDTEWWYINTHLRITKALKAGAAARAKSPRAKSPKAAAKSPKGKGKAAAAAAAAAAADDSAMTDDTAKDVKSSGPVNLRHGEAPAADGSADIPMVGRDISAFASFFRLTRSRNPVTGEAVKVHSLAWAVVDPTAKVYYADPVLDVAAADVVAETIKRGSYSVDGRMRKAFLEVCEKGNVPLPDRKMSKAATVALDKLDLDYAGQTLTKDEKGNYLMHCEQPDRGLSLTLKLVPKKKAVRQGNDGVVKIGLKAETMFYYFIPRLHATGTLTIDGKSYEVEGNAWYDHEFGSADGKDKSIPNPNAKPDSDVGVQLPGTHVSANGAAGAGNGKAIGSSKDEKIVIQPKAAAAAAAAPAAEKKKETSYAWNWFSMQLEDGTDVTATLLIDPKAKEILDNFAITIGPNSERTEYREGVSIKPLNNYQSIRTTFDYPTRWNVSVAGAQLDVTVEAAFEDQEFVTLMARPAFWEGRMNITGTYQGKPIKGVGFLERQGFEDMSSLDVFFKKISKQVLKEIEILLPMQPNRKQICTLMANDANAHLMEGVNDDVFKRTITQPLREIIDRGGKSWRSFSMLLCMDAVGGYSPRYKHWLAMPEIMHVGSLIVDDIQDKSETRRGGPSCHRVHGEPVAINAGTAAYFMSLDMLQKMTPWMTKDDRLEMYDLFFLTLRGGHAGQAFDIYGLDYMMDEVVEKGAGPLLEQRVKCTHRLKSAVPAGNLARMGALAGGAKPDQVQGLGVYLESIGVAFQIIDDVLNLRGFAGNTKTRGEDIMAGKITYPVAKAMTRIKSQAERKRVWDIIKSKPQDKKVVEALCDDLEKIGAIEACVEESAEMVEDAWRKLDAVIPDSFYKMLLRSFGWYVLQRHY